MLLRLVRMWNRGRSRTGRMRSWGSWSTGWGLRSTLGLWRLGRFSRRDKEFLGLVDFLWGGDGSLLVLHHEGQDQRIHKVLTTGKPMRNVHLLGRFVLRID